MDKVKEKKFSPEDLQIVELPEREAMLKLGPVHIKLNNAFRFNKLF